MGRPESGAPVPGPPEPSVAWLRAGWRDFGEGALAGCPVCNNPAALGDRTNGRLLNALGWGTTLLIGLASMALLATLLLRGG